MECYATIKNDCQFISENMANVHSVFMYIHAHILHATSVYNIIQYSKFDYSCKNKSSKVKINV